MLRFPSRAGRRPLAFTLAALTTLSALTACADQLDPVEPEGPPAADGEEAARADLGFDQNSRAHWADAYLFAANPADPGTIIPDANLAFNRSGGAISYTWPEGTIGRYVVTFSGLSTLLGPKSTVHASARGSMGTYCKPVSAYLASDQVEVRCFKIGTGLPANSAFYLLVTRNYADLAFAYAHRDNGSSYTPDARGSWNLAGTSNVARSGVGQYRVTFNGLGAQLPPDVAGHVQVNAVGTSNAHCNAANWYTNGTPNLTVDVQCYSAGGVPADAKFTVLFLGPTDHLAYAFGDNPTAAAYSPLPHLSSNPAYGAITIIRTSVGLYDVVWDGADPAIFRAGNLQVTSFGDNAQCTVDGPTYTGNTAVVRCFGPDGARRDGRYSVMLGS